MKEIWLPVITYEGFYEVSNLGKVRSVVREFTNSLGHKRKLKSTVLKPAKDGGGYSKVNLYKSGVVENVAVHRLVALAFVPEVQFKNLVNHINGIKADNRVENLEWVTDRENKLHAIDLGLLSVLGSENPCAQIDEHIVLKICEMLDNSTLNQREIGSRFNVSNNVISLIHTGTTWNHLTKRKETYVKRVWKKQ